MKSERALPERAGSGRTAGATGLRVPEYGYATEGPSHDVAYLEPAAAKLLPRMTSGLRVLDVGCGNGYWAGRLSERGCVVVGIDPSEQGIRLARRAHPAVRFECADVTEDLLPALGEEPFDLVLSLEVVEHVYLPARWANACFNALKPGGRLICSTPYHGYVKNLALSLTGGWDRHFSPLWHGGHIKFWSRRTLQQLLKEAGFRQLRFAGAGRLPYLWKSMLLAGERPPDVP